ncbi:MAG: FAD-dependent oxidoreductase [Bacteroidetes bacterium]|nr:FAD-dependent oxidoreductase [Bacteroidota bacterium]
MAVPDWQTGKVIRIEQATQNTRRYFIEISGTDNFQFKPGQFVTLDLPIHEQRNKRWRSYSIASAPDGTNVIELVIVLLDGGAGTNYLFNEISEGSELTLRGPQGVFTLHDEIDKDIFMICTGTGIAPFRSMINHIRNHKLEHQNLHLIFGTRYKGDLLYEEEMRALQSEMPKFTYHPVLSRENIEGYNNGYVHNVYEELCKGNQPADFMLCGWKVMIDEAKQRIQALGYDKKSIHLELYG